MLPKSLIKLPVCLVSSQAITCVFNNIFVARKEISSRLPIGVATTYNIPMIDSLYLLTWAGPFALLAIFLIVFAESGLFFGFFLPGDSLLFTAGLLSATGIIPFMPLLICSFVAAVLGDNVGYWFGHKVGPKIFAREDSRFFKKHHLVAAQQFYEKHGSKTIVLARFVPFVRTFAPIVAGAANMPYKTFYDL